MTWTGTRGPPAGGSWAGAALAGLDLRSADYVLWWGIAGLIAPAGFAALLFIMVRTLTGGGRARLPVDSRGAITVVAHLLRPDASLTFDRWQAPSCRGVLVIKRGQVQWHFDRRDGWTAPAGVLLVTGVHPGTDGPVCAGVDLSIGGTGEWSGGWRVLLGGVEPQKPARGLRSRARRRRDAALAVQLAAALVAQGAIDAQQGESPGPRKDDALPE
jgi:hypothetical protein